MSRSDVRSNEITVLWGAGAAAFAGYRTFQTFPELFWPTREKRSVLQITEKEEALLVRIHRALVKHKVPTTLDSYLRIIDDYFSTTEKLQSETILRDDLDFNHPLLWSNVTDLGRRLTNLRKAICSLTVAHYSDGAVDPAASTPGFYQNCCHLLDFLGDISALAGDSGIQTPVVDLFTTNYDILLEHLLYLDIYRRSRNEHPALHRAASEWTLDNGFRVDKESRAVELEAAEGDLRINWACPWYVADPGCAPYARPMGEVIREPRPHTRRLRIHRLHGCVAWLRGNVARPEIYFTLARPAEVLSFDERLCAVYPGHNDSLGNPPHVDAWRAFQTQLDRSRIVIIVGFSFRDPDILTALGRRLNRSDRDFHLVIINPQAPPLESLVETMIAACKDYCPPAPDWRGLLLDRRGAIHICPHPFPLESSERKSLRDKLTSILNS